MTTDSPHQEASVQPSVGRVPIFRALLGGVLMGLANLVPGVSGGTMLVAAGIYDRFIRAIASVTRLRFTKDAVLLLAVVVLGAGLAIGGGAKGVSLALADARWQTYCVFIGLTLGGVPAMIAFCRPFCRGTWVGALVGVLVMASLVYVQGQAHSGGSGGSGWLLLVLGGAAGAGAMILPGVSGAYLLLLLGQYRTIVDSIRETVSAAGSGDVAGIGAQLHVLVPVGVGVLIGIVGISNLLRLALRRARNLTMGILLGLLVAAPAGLWPYKHAQPPGIGEVIEGDVVTEATLAEVQDPSNAKDWPEQLFTPTPVQVGLSVLFIAAGAAVTLGVSVLGTRLESRKTD